MYGFMQQTVLTPANYPRSLFREHDHYLQWLGNYAIVGGYTDDNLRILLNNYAISQMRLGVEATIGDSTFAAMLLQRPVVIVRPREYPWEILRLPEHLRPQWNSDNQILEIFFPDGSTMVKIFFKLLFFFSKDHGSQHVTSRPTELCCSRTSSILA